MTWAGTPAHLLCELERGNFFEPQFPDLYTNSNYLEVSQCSEITDEQHWAQRSDHVKRTINVNHYYYDAL